MQTETRTARVAIVKSTFRRGAIARALHLIKDDLERVVTPEVLIKPNLVSHRRQLPSTHRDALSAVLDGVFAAGATSAVVAEGASNAREGFKRFGYLEETAFRPVRFFDINQDETEWVPLELVGVDGSTRTARVSRTVAQAGCRVSVALLKTHVTSIVTMSLKNMLSSIHPFDRVMMHGHAPGDNGYQGWKRSVVEFLKGDGVIVNGLTRGMGRIKRLVSMLSRLDRPGGWRRLSPADLGFLRSVDAMYRNLVALNRVVRPDVSVLDGSVAMHREGPRHGTPRRMDVAIVGVDPVAVDVVGAAVMGFEPDSINYLRLADLAGLGVSDLGGIEIVGDSIEAVRQRLVPHSNHAVQRHFARFLEIERNAMNRPRLRRSEDRQAIASSAK